jgi:DNA-binding GntR family transcriptional regulator
MAISKAQKVYNLIKKAIVNRRLSPGAQLKENSFSEKLDISRTPIRQAFQLLEEEGLVENIPNKGTYVVNPTLDEMIEASEMRLFLEEKLADQLIDNITEEEIKALETLVEKELNSYEIQNILEYLEINKEFHMILANTCNNRFLKEAIEKIINVMHVHLIFYDKFYQVNINNSRGLKQHKAIVKNIKEGNRKALKEVMLEHTMDTLEEIKSNKSKSGDLFDDGLF